MICILLNTFIMATESVDMTKDHENTLEEANLAFVIIFAFEMVVKIFGLGIKDYFMQKSNTFDAILVVLSILEISLTFSSIDLSSLVVLRGFRVFRVLKLAKSW